VSDDPTRWLEGGEPFMQSLLEAGRTELPDAARMENLAAKLGPAILGGGGAGGAGGASATKASVWGSTLTKAIGACVVTAGVVVGAVGVRSALAPTPVPVRVEEPVPAADGANVHNAPTVASESEPVRPAASAPATAVAVPSARPSPVAPAEDAEAETRLLHRAQDELGGSPARALSTCQEHLRRFPRGILAQEREVLAIDALVRLGRRGEATGRAESFARSFPSSSHRRRIEALLSAP